MQFKEVNIAKIDDLKNGEMKTIKVEDHSILLSKIDGNYYAVGAFCTHYGAELSGGILSGNRIVCPWHHACFNAQTGRLEEPPALDDLPEYQVKIVGDNVVVKLPEKSEDHKMPQMVKHNTKKDRRIFVIAGAGASGNMAAQTLREYGFQGRIIMVSRENRMPYDRPNLSKDYLSGEAEEEWMPLRSREYYEKFNIELLLNREIVRMNIPTSSITFNDQETIVYDKLLLATGGIPIMPDIPGMNLKNVFTLRSYDDSDRIIKVVKDVSEVVIIGAGFIGMETADSLTKRGLSVTVVAPESVPFEKVLGRDVGKIFLNAHEKNGVKFELNQMVEKFSGRGMVESVVMKNGKEIKSDLVIVGTGIKPATAGIQGLELNEDGGIKVDKYFQAADNVYATGDIAHFPDWRTGENMRIEHWRSSEQQGRIAAQNMAGEKIESRAVPFFWTNQAGIYFRYVGHAESWDEEIIHGSFALQNFLVFYVKDDQVNAVAGVNRDREMCAIEELMRLQKMPDINKIRNNEFEPLALF